MMDRFEAAKIAVAKLTSREDAPAYVTTRWVMNTAAGLSQSSARTQLNKLVRLGWLTVRRIPSIGDGYTPTDIGRMGFAACLPIDDE